MFNVISIMGRRYPNDNSNCKRYGAPASAVRGVDHRKIPLPKLSYKAPLTITPAWNEREEEQRPVRVVEMFPWPVR